jgi:hypothetical protein
LPVNASAVFPAVVLAVVAASQVVLTQHAALTPWKGGGFGMFSTLDHGAFRAVTVVIDGPERSETFDMPPSLEVLAARAANCPADWLLRRLAVGIAARERRYERPVTRITIHVWRTHFHPVTLHATEHTLRIFVHDVGPVGTSPATPARRG